MDDYSTRPVAVMHRNDDAVFAAASGASLPAGAGRRGAGRPDLDLRPADIAVRDDPVKVVFDRTAALFGLLLLLPLLLLVALLIYARDPGPVLFAHPRIGRGGRTFRCLKFRTMVRNGDEVLARYLEQNPEAAREWDATRKLKHDPRVTTLGQRLRKSSIDELPQLLNVLKGEMSLVGPRPIVAEEARYYGKAMRDYASVRPGLTGLWQVGGRSDTSYADRVRLDQTYVRTRSLWLDLRIILRTVVVVVKGRGSY